MHPPPWLKFVWRKGFAKGGLSGFILAAHLYLLKIVPLSGHETSPAPFRFTIPPVLPRSNRIFRLFHSTTHPSCQDYSTNGRLFFSIRRIFNRINSFQRLVRFLQTRGDRSISHIRRNFLGRQGTRQTQKAMCGYIRNTCYCQIS